MAGRPDAVIRQWPDLSWMLPAGDRSATTGAGSRIDGLRPVGKAMVGLGLVVVLFAAYQLWGTGIVERHEQRRLGRELALSMQPGSPGKTAPAVPVAPAPAPMSAPAVPVAPAPAPMSAPAVPVAPPAEGEAIARLNLPAIGVSKTVVQGVQRDTLRQGPGHYPSSALPGQRGNVALAGHRTTNGAPFFDLDQLAPGDEITLETPDGMFTYEVEGHEGPDGRLGHRIVDPSAVEVIADHGDDRLTLTACNPKYSARERIVVSALLVDGPAPDPPAQPPTQAQPVATAPTPLEAEVSPRPVGETAATVLATEDQPAVDSLGWQSAELDPTLLWATIFALVAFVGWIGGRFWQPRTIYAATGPVAAVPLVLFYFHLERMLPAF